MLFCRLHTPWIPTFQYSGIAPRTPLLLVLTPAIPSVSTSSHASGGLYNNQSSLFGIPFEEAISERTMLCIHMPYDSHSSSNTICL